MCLSLGTAIIVSLIILENASRQFCPTQVCEAGQAAQQGARLITDHVDLGATIREQLAYISLPR